MTTPRDRALDAAKQAINAGGYWLPVDGQAAVADVIVAVYEAEIRRDAFPDVQGHCPACRGQSLFLGDGGYVTCSRIDCPDPDAPSQALGCSTTAPTT